MALSFGEYGALWSRRHRSSGVEQLICNQLVGGSTPSGGSCSLFAIRYWLFALSAGLIRVLVWLMANSEQPMASFGEVPEWTKGADCKSAGEAFGGSNPPLPTKQGRT